MSFINDPSDGKGENTRAAPAKRRNSLSTSDERRFSRCDLSWSDVVNNAPELNSSRPQSEVVDPSTVQEEDPSDIVPESGGANHVVEGIAPPAIDGPGSSHDRVSHSVHGYVPKPPRIGSDIVPTAHLPGYASVRTSGSSANVQLVATNATSGQISPRSSVASVYLSARTSISARTTSSSGFVSARTSGLSPNYNTPPSHWFTSDRRSGPRELPLFNPDSRLNTQALVNAMPGTEHTVRDRSIDTSCLRTSEPSQLRNQSVSESPAHKSRASNRSSKSNPEFFRRIRNISNLCKEDFDSCQEPWALGSICTWLQSIFHSDHSFTYEELVLSLAALFLYKSLIKSPTKALNHGSVLALRLRKEDPPIFSVTKDGICKWVSPLKRTCGVIPALTGGGCYSSRSHGLTTAGSRFLQYYSPHCSKLQVRRQPSTIHMEPQPGHFSFGKGCPSVSDWNRLLKRMDLLPALDVEHNWSERGQHAEFKRTEQIPLRVERALGHGASALVESVMCRRIRLARKRVRCNWRLKREDAVKEVAHLQRAQHAHILRVVGTYIVEKSKDLYILMYPVTEYNLSEFMDEEVDPDLPKTLRSFFPCLASTLAFLHDKHHIKHMDIKPENILVRNTRNSTKTHHSGSYKVYLADFGISRSYASLEESETNSVTSFTPLYAAPEVVSQELRGFKADVFSLGCVFTEMVAVICSFRDALEEIREQSGRRPFYVNIVAVQKLLSTVYCGDGGYAYGNILPRPCIWYARCMINDQPQNRPSAATVRDFLEVDGLVCNTELPEAFEVAQPLSGY